MTNIFDIQIRNTRNINRDTCDWRTLVKQATLAFYGEDLENGTPHILPSHSSAVCLSCFGIELCDHGFIPRASLYNDSNTEVYVAFAGTRFCGAVSIERKLTHHFLHSLCVSFQYRGNAVGKRLVEAACARHTDVRLTVVKLRYDVSDDVNTQIYIRYCKLKIFYQNLGFLETGDVKTGWRTVVNFTRKKMCA